jgi:hypothetical protein
VLVSERLWWDESFIGSSYGLTVQEFKADNDTKTVEIKSTNSFYNKYSFDYKYSFILEPKCVPSSSALIGEILEEASA